MLDRKERRRFESSRTDDYVLGTKLSIDELERILQKGSNRKDVKNRAYHLYAILSDKYKDKRISSFSTNKIRDKYLEYKSAIRSIVGFNPSTNMLTAFLQERHKNITVSDLQELYSYAHSGPQTRAKARLKALNRSAEDNILHAKKMLRLHARRKGFDVTSVDWSMSLDSILSQLANQKQKQKQKEEDVLF